MPEHRCQTTPYRNLVAWWQTGMSLVVYDLHKPSLVILYYNRVWQICTHSSNDRISILMKLNFVVPSFTFFYFLANQNKYRIFCFFRKLIGLKLRGCQVSIKWLRYDTMTLEVSFYLLSNFIHHKIVLSVSTVNPFPVMKTGFHNIH